MLLQMFIVENLKITSQANLMENLRIILQANLAENPNKVTLPLCRRDNWSDTFCYNCGGHFAFCTKKNPEKTT